MRQRASWSVFVGVAAALALGGCAAKDRSTATATAQEMVIQATPTPMAGIIQENTISTTATVVAVDMKTRHVTLRGPEGKTFTIKAGEKVALVGPTGSGKSSIIRLLCRLYEPQKGRILLDGTDIRDLCQADLHRHIGVVLQDAFLFSGDVQENIALGEQFSLAEIEQAARQVNVHDLILQLPDGYFSQVRARGTNLSGGQKQLLAFARVAIRQPKILVLDEATASLDVQTEALIQSALENLWQGRTAIIIAHRLSTIRHVHRILVLKHGAIVESGSHDELIRRGGLYASLYALEQREELV